ncbi:MAG: NAD(P)/FAD-dependent oxidoreductase [Longimicrobiales bacterium]
MSRPRFEVIVVGAGPAGSHASRRLAELGFRVLLLDRSPGPRQAVICSGIVGQEAFDRFDLPASATVDQVRKARFYSPSGGFWDYRTKSPFAQVVDRSRFDSALVERAVGAGVTVRRGVTVREVNRTPEGISVGCRGPGSECFAGRALIVATGHQPWLHRAAGLGSPPGYVQGVHLDVPFRGLESAELYFGRGVAPGFFAWAVPFGRETARLGVLAKQGGRRVFRRFLELDGIRERLLGPRGAPDLDYLAASSQSRGIVQGVVSPSFSERILAVGEAAGQVKTTTAGGIYYGMVGAEAAVRVLHRGLKADRLDSESLSTYEADWRAEIGREIEAGFDLQTAAEHLDDSGIDDVFGVLRGEVGPLLRSAIRFDWHRAALGVLLRRPGVHGLAGARPGVGLSL